MKAVWFATLNMFIRDVRLALQIRTLDIVVGHFRG